VSSERIDRIRSGVIYGSVILGSAWLSHWAFLAVLTTILILSKKEVFTLFKSVRERLSFLVFLTLSLLLLYLLYLDEPWHAISLIIAAVIFDTTCYYGGRTFGGPKLVPKISPGKTWSGFILGVLVLVVVTNIYLSDEQLNYNSSVERLLLGVGVPALLSLVLLSGDLLISAFKRRAGLKDTGTILPGHGGILDRIDSILFVGIAGQIFYFGSSL